MTASTEQHVAIRETPCSAQVNLRGNAADPLFAGKVREVLGHALPLAPNTWAGDATNAALWLGPDEWLVVATERRASELEAALRSALAGQHSSVVDLSANRAILEISGPDARTVLAKGCPLDLHASAFGPGQCAQSLLAKSQVILQCIEAPAVIRLYVRISFAPYVVEWLRDAAAELAASSSLDMHRLSSRLA